MSNKIYFTPGPSQLFYSVPFHLKNALNEDIPSISHRSAKFQSIFEETRNNLKQVLNLPDGYQIFFTGSATEVWERIFQNLVSHHSYHFVNGSFSKRFYQFGAELGFLTSNEEADLGREFGSFKIPEEADLVSFTINETSAGYTFDMNQIQSLRAEHPTKLFAFDLVSIAPVVPIDYNLMDTGYFSVQKCFGLPAGLGVWIVNNQALDRANEIAKKRSIGTFHSLPSLAKNASKNQTPETPNVLSIYLLNKVCEDLLSRGMKQIQNDTIYKSTLLYGLFENTEGLQPFIESKTNRSKTVCVAEVMGSQSDLLTKLDNVGMIVGKGYGEYKEKHIRIANFPTHSKEQVEMLVDQIEKALVK